MGKQVIVLASQEQCTGCAACYAICPTDSIRMTDENKLHKYPVIHNTCISCGKCQRCCPVLNIDKNNTNERIKQIYHFGWHLSLRVRKKSTSGGIATGLTEQALSEGMAVCGAAFDKQWNVYHRFARSIEDAKSFAGSKYVQSATDQCLKEAIQRIRKGEKIFFIGTPCQTEALRMLTSEDDKQRIVTCEIICHGVNSPLVWEDYVHFLEKRHKARLVRYNFRSKSSGWQKRSGGGNLKIYYKLSSGKNIDEPSWKNLFHSWFGKHYMLRPSCLSCKFRCEQRRSDITIGDFWNIERILPSIDVQELYYGVSAVIASTKKGKEFLSRCTNLKISEVDASSSKMVLKGFIENKTADIREAELHRMLTFEQEYLKKGIDEMSVLYPATTYWGRLKDIIKSKLDL